MVKRSDGVGAAEGCGKKKQVRIAHPGSSWMPLNPIKISSFPFRFLPLRIFKVKTIDFFRPEWYLFFITI